MNLLVEREPNVCTRILLAGFRVVSGNLSMNNSVMIIIFLLDSSCVCESFAHPCVNFSLKKVVRAHMLTIIFFFFIIERNRDDGVLLFTISSTNE